MSLWIFLLIVFVAGALGGVVNALLSDNGFPLPKMVITGPTPAPPTPAPPTPAPPTPAGPPHIYQPGFLGNALIGGVAAMISWGLYGPFAASYIAGGPTSIGSTSPAGLTLSALVGAVLIGIGGARWLTNEVDKTLLHNTAIAAQLSQGSEEKANQIATATPREAMRIALQ